MWSVWLSKCAQKNVECEFIWERNLTSETCVPIKLPVKVIFGVITWKLIRGINHINAKCVTIKLHTVVILQTTWEEVVKERDHIGVTNVTISVFVTVVGCNTWKPIMSMYLANVFCVSIELPKKSPRGRHMRTHTRETSWKWGLCYRRTAQEGDLTSHMTLVHILGSSH